MGTPFRPLVCTDVPKRLVSMDSVSSVSLRAHRESESLHLREAKRRSKPPFDQPLSFFSSSFLSSFSSFGGERGREEIWDQTRWMREIEEEFKTIIPLAKEGDPSATFVLGLISFFLSMSSSSSSKSKDALLLDPQEWSKFQVFLQEDEESIKRSNSLNSRQEAVYVKLGPDLPVPEDPADDPRSWKKKSDFIKWVRREKARIEQSNKPPPLSPSSPFSWPSLEDFVSVDHSALAISMFSRAADLGSYQAHYMVLSLSPLISL